MADSPFGTRWIAGIVAAVLVALIVYYVEQMGPGPHAKIRVVAFTQYGETSTAVPTADVTVENEGKDTAENCVVHWEPGMQGFGGSAEEVSSGSLALNGSQSQSCTLDSTVDYGSRGVFNGSAWADCDNTQSPAQDVSVNVLI